MKTHPSLSYNLKFEIRMNKTLVKLMGYSPMLFVWDGMGYTLNLFKEMGNNFTEPYNKQLMLSLVAGSPFNFAGLSENLL